MDVLLLEDRSTVVEFYPPERPASATLAFLSPSGTSLATPAVTLDTLQRTISVVDDEDPALVSVTGSTGSPVEGRRYWFVPATTGVAEDMVRLSEIVDGQLAFDDPPPGGFAINDTLRGARLTATIPSTATGARGVNFRLVWTVTGADSVVRVYQQLAHVVATQYRAAVSASQARAHVASMWPDQALRYRRGWFLDIAERASERVWRRIRTAGRFQHLLGDANDFAAAGRYALDVELLAAQLVPATVIDRQDYLRSLEHAMQREIDDVLGSRPYDERDTGDLSDTSLSRPITQITARRV